MEPLVPFAFTVGSRDLPQQRLNMVGDSAKETQEALGRGGVVPTSPNHECPPQSPQMETPFCSDRCPQNTEQEAQRAEEDTQKKQKPLRPWRTLT